MRTVLSCLLVLLAPFSRPLLALQVKRPPHMTTIRGVVRDAESHLTLEHVIVVLEKETGGFIDQAETDRLGKFIFESPGEAVFLVRVRFPGYEERSQRVDLATASSAYVNFDLKPTGKQPGSTPAAGADESVDINDTAVPEKARKEYEKGRELFVAHKDAAGSVGHLQKAVKIYDSFPQAYILLGMAYIEIGKPDDARAALERAITLNAKSAPANITLGMLLNHQKDFAGAEKYLSRGIELNPEAPQAHYELAKSYWAQGRWQEAEPHVQRALELKPDMADAHVLMGNVALRKGDSQKAVAEFKEYLRLEPNGPMASAAQQLINKIGQQNH